jgi:hypothetical protein
VTEADVLLCFRVADSPVPSTRSFTDACRMCGAAIWVAYSSPPVGKRLCMQCGMPLLAKDKDAKFEMTEAQRADTEEALKKKPIN